MTRTELRFTWRDDETCEVDVDNAFVGYLTYSDLGWEGIKEARNILSSIARLKGWEISVSGEPGI